MTGSTHNLNCPYAGIALMRAAPNQSAPDLCPRRASRNTRHKRNRRHKRTPRQQTARRNHSPFRCRATLWEGLAVGSCRFRSEMTARAETSPFSLAAARLCASPCRSIRTPGKITTSPQRSPSEIGRCSRGARPSVRNWRIFAILSSPALHRSARGLDGRLRDCDEKQTITLPPKIWDRLQLTKD